MIRRKFLVAMMVLRYKSTILFSRVDTQKASSYKLLRRASQRIACLAVRQGSPLRIIDLGSSARIQPSTETALDNQRLAESCAHQYTGPFPP